MHPFLIWQVVEPEAEAAEAAAEAEADPTLDGRQSILPDGRASLVVEIGGRRQSVDFGCGDGRRSTRPSVPDLAALRASAVADLPEDEREAFRAFEGRFRSLMWKRRVWRTARSRQLKPQSRIRSLN